jgi:hypothetical protein
MPIQSEQFGKNFLGVPKIARLAVKITSLPEVSIINLCIFLTMRFKTRSVLPENMVKQR